MRKDSQIKIDARFEHHFDEVKKVCDKVREEAISESYVPIGIRHIFNVIKGRFTFTEKNGKKKKL